jgi:hypothetical protein
LYFGTSHTASIVHAQFRMKLKNLRSHLFGLHVINTSFCLCSDRIELYSFLFPLFPAACATYNINGAVCTD